MKQSHGLLKVRHQSVTGQNEDDGKECPAESKYAKRLQYFVALGDIDVRVEQDLSEVAHVRTAEAADDAGDDAPVGREFEVADQHAEKHKSRNQQAVAEHILFHTYSFINGIPIVARKKRCVRSTETEAAERDFSAAF